MKTREGKSGTRVVTLILLLLWMAVIFWFSAQDATKSGGLSSSLSEKLAFLQNRVLHLGWTKQKIMDSDNPGNHQRIPLENLPSVPSAVSRGTLRTLCSHR